MDEQWTLTELVAEAATRIASLPAPKNGQIRAVPDERTVRYYGTIGLLDKASGARGRTALYGPRHLAQIVAIKRLQAMGRSLAEIQAMWWTMDAPTLQRMSGIEVAPSTSRAARKEFWKRGEPPHEDAPVESPEPSAASSAPAPLELRLEIAPHLSLLIAMPGIAITQADLHAIYAAAAPLVAELAKLTTPEYPEKAAP